MKSLSELNAFANTSVTVTDARPSRVIFDLVSPQSAQDQDLNIFTTTVNISPTINILDIWNYATANVRYSVTIRPGTVTPLTGSSLAWSSVPSPLSLATAGNTYTITGFTNRNDWLNLGQLVWTLPANYATKPLWYLDLSITYYDSELGQDVVKDWRAYDENFYYLADLNSLAALAIAPVKTVRTTVSISGAMTFVLATGSIKTTTVSLSTVATLGLTARRYASLVSNLNSALTITNALFGFRKQFSSSLSSSSTMTITARKTARAVAALSAIVNLTLDIKRTRSTAVTLPVIATIYCKGSINGNIIPLAQTVTATMTTNVNLAFTFTDLAPTNWYKGGFWGNEYFSSDSSYEGYSVWTSYSMTDDDAPDIRFYNAPGGLIKVESDVGFVWLKYQHNNASSQFIREAITTLTPDYDDFEWYASSYYTRLRNPSVSNDGSRIIVGEKQHSFSSLPNYTYIFEPFRTAKTITQYNFDCRNIDGPFTTPPMTGLRPYGPIANPSTAYFQVASHSDFAYGTGDFTIELFFVGGDNSTFGSILDHRNSNTDTAIHIKITDTVSGAGGVFQIYIGNTLVISSNTTILNAANSHIALVRASGTLKLYVGGVEQTQTYSDSNNYAQRAINFMTDWNQSNYLQYGLMGDIKISNVAKYTANFTPTKFLLHNESSTVLMIRPGLTFPMGNTYGARDLQIYDDVYIRKHKLSQYLANWISGDGQWIFAQYSGSGGGLRILNYNPSTTNWDHHSTISSSLIDNNLISNDDATIITTRTPYSSSFVRTYTRSGTTWTYYNFDVNANLGKNAIATKVELQANRMFWRVRQDFNWPNTPATYIYSVAIFDWDGSSWTFKQQLYDDNDLFNINWGFNIGHNDLGEIQIGLGDVAKTSQIFTEIPS